MGSLIRGDPGSRRFRREDKTIFCAKIATYSELLAVILVFTAMTKLAITLKCKFRDNSTPKLALTPWTSGLFWPGHRPFSWRQIIETMI